MENIDSAETVAWVKAENALTRRYLDGLPTRAAIAASYRKLYDHPYEIAPFRAGTHWFYYRNSGRQAQASLFIRDSETGPGRLFFDPNQLSRDGKVQLAETSFSHDGLLLAYSTQNSGSDWETWHIKSVATGRDLVDTIGWSKYGKSAAWIGDRGFYYEGYDRPPGSDPTFAKLGVHKVWFHRVGTPQSIDPLVTASTTHPDELLNVEVTADGRFVLLERAKGSGNSIAWKSRDEPDNAFRTLFSLDPTVKYRQVGNDSSRIYLRTNRNAPRFRVIAVDLNDPSRTVHNVTAETSDKLEDASLVGDTLFLSYLHDAHSVLRRQPLQGGVATDIALPGLGSVTLAPALRDNRALYYTYESYAYPQAIFRYEPDTATQGVTWRYSLGFDESAFVTEQIFAASKDGTRIPVFVTHRRDMPLDGTTPTLLYGYGGFGISWTPYFWVQNAMWLKMGGAYAVATLRGGGEFGEAWHDAGRLLNKQHVFDDCIAVARLLIDRRITTPSKLAVNGGSNGGLMVGAVLTQRPELFGAAVAEEGVYDMLRYPDFTIGKNWISEYGSAIASAVQFSTLYAYSPVNNVRVGTAYPPTLIMTADHDDRVFPAHSFKFAAALQHAQSSSAPILLRVETNEGHFAGLSYEQRIALASDFYAFLVQNLRFTPML